MIVDVIIDVVGDIGAIPIWSTYGPKLDSIHNMM
jgi:hypothetical protein